ncbi:MAG: beta-xylosidase, partial [Lacibacter sp.]
QETVVYCGDRWANFAGNGLGYNQWFPLSFNGAEPYFNSLSSWNINAKTGEWKVAANHNYVMNGSFEADRRRIPSHVKPVQEFLLGWITTVIEGNKVSLDSNSSPVLNYFNTATDRKTVIGEKSLQITDKVDFVRSVKQTVSSTPYVLLKDGVYRLTAYIKNSNGFDKLQMYATSNNKTNAYTITAEHNEWTSISIDNVLVKGGKVEIGFIAEGKAKAFCYVDDVVLVKIK